VNKTYRIFYEWSLNINFDETSLGNVINQASLFYQIALKHAWMSRQALFPQVHCMSRRESY